jgi:hypothetical protein
MPSLELFPKIFKDHVADQRANDGDDKIRDGKDIGNSRKQALPLRVTVSKIPHQKVGIEKKYNEAHLNQRPPKRG